MRHFAMTGMETTSMISVTLVGSAMRATPPSARMSAGTRSSAMTATAPASSATLACSAVVTSMMTPPFSISAKPVLTRRVPVSMSIRGPSSPLRTPTLPSLRGGRGARSGGRDRERVGEQLDPGVAGVQRDLVALLVQELRHVVHGGTAPGAHDHLTVAQDVDLAAPGGDD